VPKLTSQRAYSVSLLPASMFVATGPNAMAWPVFHRAFVPTKPL
jgi:hypothetical protein